nr:zinc finger, CCHC-type [Tanacetum cinerariifolium]
MRTTVVLVPTRNQSWNVRSVVRLVTSKGIAEMVKRTMQMLVVRERGLRTNPKTKVDAIAWWIDSGATTYVCKDRYSAYMSSSTVVNLSLWHACLGHVHYKRMLEMSKDDLIPTIDENPKKCITCMLMKITGKLFQRIIHETTTPYTPQQNGVAERKNRALKEMVNSMLSYSSLSEGLCGEAMLTACYLLNRGCRAVVRLPDPKWKTLDEKGIDCIFVGYPKHSKEYRPKDIIPNLDESQRDDHSNDVPNEIPEPRKAMQSRDYAFRKEAIDDEIGSIMENNTWVLSDLPPSCKPLGCKWIFKRKMKVDRTVNKFKARLIIQGFRQKEGIDYFDTYAPVARITTIILLLALAAIHNLVIRQMDVKTIFLNVDLEEEVYMKQPE